MKPPSYPRGGLDEAYVLQKIYNRSHYLERLTVIVHQQLPEPFKSHVFVINYKDNQLILGTQEQLLASKLRYLIPQLKNALQQKAAFKQLSLIKLKITTPLTTNSKIHQPNSVADRIYSKKTAQLLFEFSDSLDGNEEDLALQQALKRLALHIKQK